MNNIRTENDVIIGYRNDLLEYFNQKVNFRIIFTDNTGWTKGEEGIKNGCTPSYLPDDLYAKDEQPGIQLSKIENEGILYFYEIKNGKTSILTQRIKIIK